MKEKWDQKRVTAAPAKLKLYSNPNSRGRIARWMLEEVGEPYDVEFLAYGGAMKTPEFLAINPMGKVPTLVHNHQVITETPAICVYLAETFPKACLAPTESERAEFWRWIFFAAGPLESAITNTTLGVKHNPEKESMLGYGSLADVLDVMQAKCEAGVFLAGSRFTAVDVYAGSQLAFGMQFGAVEKRPAFEHYCSRIQNRDAYKRAFELDKAAQPPS